MCRCVGVYLKVTCVGPDRKVELGDVGVEEDVAVDVDGRAEQEREDVARLTRRDQNGGAEVLHLDRDETTGSSQYAAPQSRRFVDQNECDSMDTGDLILDQHCCSETVHTAPDPRSALLLRDSTYSP